MVTLYGTKNCSHCLRAKKLLQSLRIPFEEKRIDENLQYRNEMAERTHGARSVPQIFIGSQYIGGADDLYRLNDERRLALLVHI